MKDPVNLLPLGLLLLITMLVVKSVITGKPVDMTMFTTLCTALGTITTVLYSKHQDSKDKPLDPPKPPEPPKPEPPKIEKEAKRDDSTE